MALTEDRSDGLSPEMARRRAEAAEFLREFRRIRKLLVWELSIGFAGTFAGLGVIAAMHAP